VAGGRIASLGARTGAGSSVQKKKEIASTIKNIQWLNYPKRFPAEGAPASFALLPISFGAGFP
jgi:hypothetical protein